MRNHNMSHLRAHVGPAPITHCPAWAACIFFSEFCAAGRAVLVAVRWQKTPGSHRVPSEKRPQGETQPPQPGPWAAPCSLHCSFRYLLGIHLAACIRHAPLFESLRAPWHAPESHEGGRYGHCALIINFLWPGSPHAQHAYTQLHPHKPAGGIHLVCCDGARSRMAIHAVGP